MKIKSQPFDVTYTVTFSGRTSSDGIPTATAQIIRDKLIDILEACMSRGYIRDYNISAQTNNIDIARKVLKKSRKK